MLWFLIQPIKRVAVIAAALFAVWAMLWHAYPAWRSARDDPDYAAAYFDGVIPYDRVVASKYRGNTIYWSCTFAGVELAPDGPSTPPAVPDRGDWRLRWPDPDEWVWTPLIDDDPEDMLTPLDVVNECASDWPNAAGERLAEALSRPGSFYVDRGDTVTIFAPAVGLAARIRYGD